MATAVLPLHPTPPATVTRPNHRRTHSSSSSSSSSSPPHRLSIIHRSHTKLRFFSAQTAAAAVPSSSRTDRKTASAVASEAITTSLENVQVYDVFGKAVPIVDLWRDRRAVVAFARHFGCVLCRKRGDLLASKKELMDAAGVALVLIGPGTVDQAKTFLEQTKFKGEIYADPTHSSYEALDFAYGVLTTFTPSAGMKIVELYMEGYRQDWGLSFKKNTVTKGSKEDYL